jgi:hypothetical protein
MYNVNCNYRPCFAESTNLAYMYNVLKDLLGPVIY